MKLLANAPSVSPLPKSIKKSLVEAMPCSAHASLRVITDTELNISLSSSLISMLGSSSIMGVDQANTLTRTLYTLCIAAAAEELPPKLDCGLVLDNEEAMSTRIVLTTLKMQSEKNTANQLLGSSRPLLIVILSNDWRNCVMQLYSRRYRP
jgi:hypothetical protein